MATHSIASAIRGKIVTMDQASTIVPNGIVYIRGKNIAAIASAEAPSPPGFEKIKITETLYPGLIELHNHLSYNALPLWIVPKKYTNRNQWSGPSAPDYHKLLTGPIVVLGKLPEDGNAIVRFVECRCLFGGVT